MRILITGGSGFIGTYLSRAGLAAGHRVTALGKRQHHSGGINHPDFHYLAADTTRSGQWQQQVVDADLIFNLAGCNIFQRWTRKYKQMLYDSRILTTENVVAALPENTSATLISTSAVGYYGNGADRELAENTPAGRDFLARLAVDWESAAQKGESKGARVVITRFGIALGIDGGALAKMVPSFKAFLGGALGSGRQWFPWIHIQDLLKALLFLSDHSELHGAFNMCAPHPVTNMEMTKALARVLKRPAKMNVPGLMLKVALGEMADVLLASQRTLPARLLNAGFQFEFPYIDAALEDLFRRQGGA